MFKERITPIKEFERKWIDKNLVEEGSYDYDSLGNKLIKRISKSDFHNNLLVNRKVVNVYNERILKGEFISEYTYSYTGKDYLEIRKSKTQSKTLVDSTIYKFDASGNMIVKGKSVYKYLYDSNGNWTERQLFHEKNSGITLYSRGVWTSRRFDEDTWVTKDWRRILYY